MRHISKICFFIVFLNWYFKCVALRDRKCYFVVVVVAANNSRDGTTTLHIRVLSLSIAKYFSSFSRQLNFIVILHGHYHNNE